MPGWLGVYILLLALPLSSWAQCTRPVVSPTSAPLDDDPLSGLKPLALGAERARQTLLIPTLHYDLFVDTIRDMYMEGSFSEEGLVSLAWQHTYSIGYLAGIMLFTAAAIPLLIFGLCLLRERCCCCRDDDDSESYAEDNRNLNFSAQVLAWFLCAGLGVCLLFLLGWVSVLLAGEFKMYGGVHRAGQLIIKTIPLVERLQEDSLDALHSTVFDRFQSLNNSIFNNLSNSPDGIREHINLSHSTNVTILFNRISGLLSTARNVSQLFQNINNIHLQLDQLDSSLTLINTLTANLTQCCSQDNSSSLAACQQLMSNSTNLQLNLSLTLSSLISNLTSSSIMIADTNPVALVDMRRTQYEQYLERIISNTTAWITRVSSQFLDSLHQNLSEFVHTTCNQYNNSSITLGLPSSQSDVASHVGPRYLSNWQQFRNLVTIAFSLSMFVLVVGVCVATFRGLFNIWLTYSYRDIEVEKNILFGAHQAGLALRKMSGWMAVAGFVAMFFFLFLLFLGSLLGRMCGNDKSYEGLIDHVFDNTSTWNNISPLDEAFLNTGTTFLKFSRLLQSCSQNSSIVEALSLNRRLNIDTNINVSVNRTNRYRDELRAVAASYPFFSFFTPELELILNQYQSVAEAPVDWELYTNLSHDQHLIDLINASSQLHQVLINLNSSVSASTCMQSLPISNVTKQLQTVLNLLNELNTCLPLTARMLETELESVRINGLSLMDDAVRTSQNVQRTASQEAHSDLTVISTSIINMVNKYLRTTQQALHCDIGQCYQLYDQFASFSDATCQDLLLGMDIYWATLLALYICLTIAMILSLALASRFMTADAARQMKNSRNAYFSLTDHTFSQMSGSLWLLFSLVVELWFAISIATDQLFPELCVDCCWTCIWAFAIVFLVLSLIVGAGLRIYQWIIIHRINASNGPRYQQIHRYWLTRVNIIQFYTQLLLFLIQDIPFVALSGIYMTSRMSPTASAFFTLTISLVNMFAFMWMLISGCGQLGEYFTWLQQEMKALLSCGREGSYTPGHHPEHHHTMNGRDVGMNGGAVYLPEGTGAEAPMTTIPLQDHRHPSHSPVEHNGTMDTSFMGQHPPPHSWETEEPPLAGDDDTDDDDGPPQPTHNYADPVKLDKCGDENDIIRRRELAAQFRQTGIEVAVPQLTRRSYAEASTPRSSNYFGSGDSFAETDMHSSVPSGYTSTDDSSCREDFEYDSDYTSRPRQTLGVGEISVDV